MKRTSEIRLHFAAVCALILVAVLSSSQLLNAQATTRFVGSITAINGTTLTVKTDSGEERQVDVPAEASVKRIAPGQKDLSTAATITFSELALGDRVLMKLDPNATGATAQAAQIIAVKQEDLAQKQQKDREDWQKRGVGGLVKNVDASGGTITVTTGAGATAKTETVHITKSTVLKRYSATSVRFDQAQPAPIDAIHIGDQLRARGEKNSDGTELTAEEVVSGTFRNIAGTVQSLDAANATLVVKDLATKKPVTIHITQDAQMRRMPERMAQMLAMRLKGTPAGTGPNAAAAGATPQPPANAAGPRAERPQGGGGGTWTQNAGGPGGAAVGVGGGDPQQMLSRAPAIQLADLQKGEAIMVVSTEGASDVTAITLLAGVEPLLQAPAASSLLSNWSMGSGGAEGAAAQ